ncbi:MAG: DUF4838 domain-containing protein [Phycisphaerae bacterium]
MSTLNRLCVCLALLMLGAMVANAADKPVTAVRGDWSATLDAKGLSLTHGGTLISKGSYVNVFTPEYKATLISSVDAWKKGTATVSADGRTLSLAADLPGGHYGYDVTLEDAAVRVTVRVSLVADAQTGPVEYAIGHIPAELLKGATIEMANIAGTVTSREPLPEQVGSGGLAPAGPVMTLKTPERTIIVEAVDFGNVYPLDGRAERFGSKQGIWPFAGLAVRAGSESISTYLIRIEAPAPPRPAGKIIVAPKTPAAGIIIAPDATKRERLAADELASYLETITGCVQTPEEATEAKRPGAIVVGALAKKSGLITQAELDKVAPDGYVVKVKGGRAAVCGWRDAGTVYGAYALLRRLGCKFYAPTCEVVPQIAALTIPECSLSDKPFYEFRNVSGNAKLGQTLKDDMMSPAELGEPGNIVHSSGYLLPYDKYHEEHPEYFALQKDGRRLTKGENAQSFDVHLCLSNPDVRRISAERMVALMDKQSDRKFFGVSQGDGFAWCECDQCKALDAVPGVEMTDRLLEYVNYIARECAKKHPDKRILTLAYTNATSPPPVRVMPEPNVMVQYCPYPNRTGCHSHDFTCEKNQQGYQDVMGWFKKCPNNMYIFDYPTGYQNYYEPFGSFWAMKSKLDLYAANGVKGLFYCGTPQNFRDMFIYVNSELLWHPKAPVEPLMKEFVDAYYGAAAPQVRQYFDFMSKEMKERPIHQMCEAPSPHTVTAAYADTALAMLAEGEAKVQGDRARLYRVRGEKLCVLFGDLNARNPINGKLEISEEQFAQRLAEFCSIARAMRITAFIRRVPTEDWLYKISRLRVTRQPWYADPVIDRLIAKPAETFAAERERYSQVAVPGGWRLDLDGFRGCKGPQEYALDCPARRAVWIYGKDSDSPQMWTVLKLDKAPAKAAKLVLTGQDDDKPGAVKIKVSINGQVVFEGPNTCAERNWSAQELAVPVGVLKQGDNEIRIATVEKSTAADQGWFMLADCVVMG